jgi:hypothetical protein
VEERRKNKGKNVFLTIQLLPQFAFDHRTPKPGILGHPLSKPFKFIELHILLSFEDL